MLIPCQRSPYTGNSDHDVSSPTLEITSATSGGQTSTLSMIQPTPVATSTEATEQHTTLTSTTTILQSTDSGEPSVNTETSKQPTMDIHTTSRPIPQHSKDITAATETQKGSTRTTTRRGGTSSEGFNMTMFMNCTSSRGQYSMYVWVVLECVYRSGTIVC